MKQTGIQIRAMQPADWKTVATLIHDSTNAWYTNRGLPKIFANGPASTLLFCETYEALDPGCCLIAIDEPGGQVAGSCFFHPRETHFSLGIMNVHPDFFGRRIAVQLLDEIVSRADEANLPIRLVSSAMNLDSYSLYNRAGFIPTAVYQDMLMTVPPAGLQVPGPSIPGKIRPAVQSDTVEMTKLEQKLAGIRREKDYRFFIDNRQGIWQTLVCEDTTGKLSGFLSAVRHPASNMIGPGVATDDQVALALIHQMLDFHRDNTFVLLAPADCQPLVATLYQWGARNCEIHLAQVRGAGSAPRGVVLPTFMPETG